MGILKKCAGNRNRELWQCYSKNIEKSKQCGKFREIQDFTSSVFYVMESEAHMFHPVAGAEK
jgi:hypothetical protein